jgi:hypothetical protein
VQSYLNELWRGGLAWTGSGVKLMMIFALMFVCPPVWIFFSLPIDIRSVFMKVEDFVTEVKN